MNHNQATAIAKKRQEHLAKLGHEVKLNHCLEMIAWENGFKNWASYKPSLVNPENKLTTLMRRLGYQTSFLLENAVDDATHSDDFSIEGLWKGFNEKFNIFGKEMPLPRHRNIEGAGTDTGLYFDELAYVVNDTPHCFLVLDDDWVFLFKGSDQYLADQFKEMSNEYKIIFKTGIEIQGTDEEIPWVFTQKDMNKIEEQITKKLGPPNRT